MFKWFSKIKYAWSERKFRKICSSLEVSEKGRYLIKYLEDIVEGKDVYIDAYEETLRGLMEDGLSREEAASFQLNVFKVLKLYGTENIDINF